MAELRQEPKGDDTEESPFMTEVLNTVVLYESGYEIRKECITMREDGSKFVSYTAYTLDGDYIGRPGFAKYLTEKKGIRPECVNPSKQSPCSVGFNAAQNKWFGWSHRGICGFGIGDKIFESRFGNESTLFAEHGNETIRNMDDAKKAAITFSAYLQ